MAYQDFRRKPAPLYSAQPVDHHDSREFESARTKYEPTPDSLLMSEVSGQARTTSKRRKAITTWWQECVAAFLLSAAAIASFATLYPYQGRPLPEWPYSITIGALLSAYSVVLRLAATFLLAEGLAQLKWRWFVNAGGMPLHDLVLHDDATRGPIGSLRLLWRLPIPKTWQWMGCGLVIVALFTGPFTQQVLQYEQCPVLADSAERDATIARASAFFGQGLHAGAATNTLIMPEQASLNAGIYAAGLVGAACSSGNCTFAPYTSVGYCGDCSDISDAVQFVVSGAGETGTSYSNTTTFVPGALSTTYREGSQIRAGFVAGGSATYDDTYGFMIVIGPPNYQSGTSASGDEPLADCSQNQTWACQGAAAAVCTLAPCVRQYQGSVTNGVFEETVVDSWKDVFDSAFLSDGSLTYASINASCLTDEESAALVTMNITTQTNEPWWRYSPPQSYNSTNGSFDLAQMEQRLLDRECLYAVDVFFDHGLTSYIGSGAFSGNVTGFRGGSDGSITDFDGPQLLQTIYNFGGISFERTKAVFENVSLSLTNYMRLNPNGTSHSGVGGSDSRFPDGLSLVASQMPAQGHAFTMKTCLRVRWVWLTLPALLAVLTLVFFVGVLFSLGRLTHDVRTWKSSPLPLMFYGAHVTTPVTSSSSASATGSQHVSDLEQAARRINVRLVHDEEGNMVLRQ